MTRFKNIYLSELDDFLEDNPNALLLDVRQEFEFNQIHLPNAVLIPLNELPYRMSELLAYQNNPLVVYCKAGVRSVHACNLLAEANFSCLYNIADGIIKLR